MWGAWSDETAFALGIDTDADGLCDSVETNSGLYRGPTDTGTDSRNPDTDGDGLMDGEEVNVFKTDPTLTDSDQDGLTDWEEVNTYLTDPTKEDTDGDLLPDLWEINNLLDPKSSAGLDGGVGDPDEDNVMNLIEYLTGTNPNDADTDADGMNDSWEMQYSLSPTDSDGENGADGDADEDGLSNLREYQNRTDPRNADSDGDGLGDLWEVENSLDPNDGTGDNGPDGDPDEDGMTNREEMLAGTDPNSAQSRFSVASLRPNNPGIVITWRTIPDKRYQVYVADDLGGEWSASGPEMMGTGEEATYVDETADSPKIRYYKILMQ